MGQCGSGESQEECGLQAFPLRPLNAAEPAEVGVEVLCGDAVEAAQPSLESAVVGVLDVIGTIYANAGSQITR